MKIHFYLENCSAKGNTATPEYGKEKRSRQSIDKMKREIDILDEKRRNWLAN